MKFAVVRITDLRRLGTTPTRFLEFADVTICHTILSTSRDLLKGCVSLGEFENGLICDPRSYGFFDAKETQNPKKDYILS